jgi:type III restriction enzyme
MKFQFDPDQPHQRAAVDAIVDLFDGQPRAEPLFSIIRGEGPVGLYAGQELTELGRGNPLVDSEQLLGNARRVQERNDIEVVDPAAPLEAWELFDEPADMTRACPHFSVEMETGTGKTYVYLRTIFELSKRYGFKKFVIVVPSVAIREGVLHTLGSTREHFRALYDNVPVESFVYDAKNLSPVRSFATSSTIQILVINIDAFRKHFTDPEDEHKSNVIYTERDGLSGRRPIEFIQAARPIVIIDEPQRVDSTEKSQEAIRALNPLCTLRYSATHEDFYNLVYRLDPVRAFELRLVKQIVVASASAEGGANDAFVRVEKVDYKPTPRAKLRIHVQTKEGPKEKSVTVRLGSDLLTLSEDRACYAQGFSVSVINAEPGNEYVRFDNGRQLAKGDTIGGMRDDVHRLQIQSTIRQHLEKELQVRSRGIKVLSLFFIDRVGNYRDYDEQGKAIGGKFARVFEAELAALAREERYQGIEWLKLPIEQLHEGYFAQDKSKRLKESREGRSTQDDEAAFELIMRDKERLLAIDEPLRFIFSHSALREGWDNPNVFQICTLNETRSSIKKRQEIGRGLRLPVDQSGARVFDDSVNRLYVMANESYEEFARALQAEYEEDCGVSFGRVPLTALARLTRIVGEAEQPIGREQAEALRSALVDQRMLDADGRLQPAFDPQRPEFSLVLPAVFSGLEGDVIDLLSTYRIERHVQRAEKKLTNRLRKDVQLGPEFDALWARIKPRTTYRVEFKTDELVAKAVAAVHGMEKVEPAKVRLATGRLDVRRGGVDTIALSVAERISDYGEGPLPDILAYLQNETDLTRSTLVRILKESRRLADFFVNPQRFMDAVARILNHELHRLLVDGIKYERLTGPGSEWEMRLFKDEEFIDYLSAIAVNRSVYTHIEYESEIEHEFARRLDQREDIKLFVKLPRGFRVDTPIGEYIPDWAILKVDEQQPGAPVLYLVRETKSTRDYFKLRTVEADKVRCGQRHFAALDLDFDVVVTAAEV